VDKYDYLIVFANEEGKEPKNDRWLYPHQYAYEALTFVGGVVGLIDTSKPNASKRISYQEAVKQWKHAATGGDTAKAKAEEKFKQYWMEKFRGGEPSPLDTVSYIYVSKRLYFVHLMMLSVLEKQHLHCPIGLFVRLSLDGPFLFAQFSSLSRSRSSRFKFWCASW
jgi:hypothetical protein